MKTTLRDFCALLAGVLLNLGLVHLAERVDTTHGYGGVVVEGELAATIPCVGPCAVHEGSFLAS